MSWKTYQTFNYCLLLDFYDFIGWLSLKEKRANDKNEQLQFLVALADAAEATIKLWESINSKEKASTTSGTKCLIQTACKEFTHRGSNKQDAQYTYVNTPKRQGNAEFSCSISWQQI